MNYFRLSWYPASMIVLVSLATKAPSKEITDEFELVQKRMAE